jgi:hypothetical protein
MSVFTGAMGAEAIDQILIREIRVIRGLRIYRSGDLLDARATDYTTDTDLFLS